MIRQSLILLAAAFSLVSCDKISREEYRQKGTPVGSSDIKKKVLLEDYTGHTCGNCPEAAEKAQYLDSLYGDRLVVMGVHAGFFANPRISGTKYRTDFRNVTSTELDLFFGNSEAGNPNGMVNRRGHDENHILGKENWSAAVAEELAKPAVAGITMDVNYTAATNLVQVSLTSTFYESYDSAVKVVVFIVEDSIVDWQSDYRLTNPDIQNYVHRHVLRGAINGTFGENLNSTSLFEQGMEITKGWQYVINPAWKSEHLSVIAVLFNSVTYEVLNVEEKHIQ